MAGEIEVRLQQGWVDFTDGQHHCSFEPIVYVAADLTEFRVLSIGKPANSGEPSLRVAAFDPMPVEPAELKPQCLRAVFTHGIKQLLDRKLLTLKPVVRVYGSSGVAASFAGYQEVLIKDSLLAAGARSVSFVKE